jgi:L-lactate utilization protein LutC
VSDARAAILERIRAALGSRSPAPIRPAPEHPRLVAPTVPPHERAERFRAVLEGVGGHVHRARGERETLERVRSILAQAGARRLLVSDAASAAALARGLPPELRRLAPRDPREALLEADAGLTGAQWGIAESGTLVLESGQEQHRLASLLPPLHVALLPVARLLGTIGEALEALHPVAGAPSARTITFITGPSRTADIELELVVGVHGPKHLHVVLLEN